MIKLACVVVLYNPTSNILKNMKLYADIFDTVILVDNSVENLHECFYENSNIIYLPVSQNNGIANALNIGLDEVTKLGYKWAMTLDQDSVMTEECVSKLKRQIMKVDCETTAIVGANYEPTKLESEGDFVDLDFMITSGSVMNMEIYQKMGAFIADMFIDAVDYEYCYRLKSKGYRIKRLNSALFTHRIGEPSYHNGIECRNYPPMRYYFITRNNLIVSHMYKYSVPRSIRLRKNIHIYSKSARYERNSFKKHLYMLIGWFDYLLWRVTGKFYCHIVVSK